MPMPYTPRNAASRWLFAASLGSKGVTTNTPSESSVVPKANSKSTPPASCQPVRSTMSGVGL